MKTQKVTSYVRYKKVHDNHSKFDIELVVPLLLISGIVIVSIANSVNLLLS